MHYKKQVELDEWMQIYWGGSDGSVSSMEDVIFSDILSML